MLEFDISLQLSRLLGPIDEERCATPELHVASREAPAHVTKPERCDKKEAPRQIIGSVPRIIEYSQLSLQTVRH